MKNFLTRAVGITLCALTAASAIVAQKKNDTPIPPPPIIYTGKLIGYFRSPSLQPSDQTSCPVKNGADAAAATASKAAAVALALGKKLPANKILVGTGDNFSPQFEARTFSPAPTQSSSGAPAGRFPPAQKELYSWFQDENRWVFYTQVERYDPLKTRIQTGTNTIPSDNVACYLVAAGYDAVVPGKHDFYFGPERLRQLARFMADEKATGGGPVQMLGANLVIKTSLIKPPEAAEDKKKWVWPDNLSLLNIKDGKEVYPWLTHARVKLTEFTPHSDVPVSLRKILTREASTEADFKAAIAKLEAEIAELERAKSEAERAKLEASNPEAAKKQFSEADKKMLAELATKIDKLSTQDVYVCPADKDRNDIKVDASCKLNPANRTFRVIGDTVVEDFGFDLLALERKIVEKNRRDDDFVLLPDTNYGLVLQSNSATKMCTDQDVSCIRFKTRQPFFHFRDSTIGENPDPKRYVYLEEKNAVIFGVVDQELGEQVGVLNFSWNNTDKDSRTVVSVEDPVEALQTQLDFFNEKHPDFHGIKILLAQMSPEHARVLGARFPEFQVVITAADGERSTNELEFSTTWVEGPHAKAFVAVPAPYFDPEQRDRFEGIVRMGRIDATYPTQFKQESYVRNVNQPAAWKLTSTRIDPQNVDYSKPVYAGAGSKSFLQLVNERFEKCQANPKPDDYYTRIQLLTLCVMREQAGADVALVQKRDFFAELPDSSLTDPEHFQEALDRIIWKGDLLSLLYVPGSALKKALDQSKNFDTEDGNALSLADERARGLQFIGVHLDAKSNKYIINELPLDEKKVYAVATTDYVGAGDTGYPDLASSALNPKNRADKFPAQLIPISSLVCRGLFSDPNDASQYCLADLQKKSYLDETIATAGPAGPSPGFGSKVSKFFKPTQQTWSEPFTLDDTVQRRPIWVLSLKNLSFTVSSLSHNMSDDDLSHKFGGVPASGVTANKTYTVAEKSEIRFSRFSHDYEFFVGSNVDYKVQSTGDESPKVDQLENRVTPEAGIVRNLLGGRGQSRLGATFTFHTEVPLAKPFTVFKLSGDDKLKITQPRRVLVLPRLGLRWQNDTNYLEAGGQVGREFKALREYRFDTTSEVCGPNAKETFGACISRLNKTTPPSVTKDTNVTPVADRRNRAGLYWKSNFSIPLWSNIKYEFSDEGNFFFNFHEDTVTDTRLWDNQKHSVKIAVFSSLSIGPSYQLIFFRNKQNRDFLVQRQFGLETTFAFDLFNRREKDVQFKHKP